MQNHIDRPFGSLDIETITAGDSFQGRLTLGQGMTIRTIYFMCIGMSSPNAQYELSLFADAKHNESLADATLELVGGNTHCINIKTTDHEIETDPKEIALLKFTHAVCSMLISHMVRAGKSSEHYEIGPQALLDFERLTQVSISELP